MKAETKFRSLHKGIAESASVIGADRLGQVIKELIKDNDAEMIPASKCLRLHRAMKLTLREASERASTIEIDNVV